MGDVAGIGPEIVVRAATEPAVRSHCRPLIVGHPKIVRRWLHRFGKSHSVIEISSPADFTSDEETALYCWNPGRDDVLDVPVGQTDACAGQAAYDYLVAATRAALAGSIDAIVTAPLSKAALHAAGLNFPGHTEILAQECGVIEVAMMLYLPPGELVKNPFGLGVAHVTLHTSIRSVPDLLTVSRIRETISLLHQFLKSAGCDSPRIGVCALNPHAGEEGLFGGEEATVISPAVEQARQSGMPVSGPIPADALLRRAASSEFDGVVAMYHDQGHIALKLLGYDRAVNITLGLPIIRTSPSHGTAYDLAGKGDAHADGLILSIQMAAALFRGRQNEKP